MYMYVSVCSCACECMYVCVKSEHNAEDVFTKMSHSRVCYKEWESEIRCGLSHGGQESFRKLCLYHHAMRRKGSCEANTQCD